MIQKLFVQVGGKRELGAEFSLKKDEVVYRYLRDEAKRLIESGAVRAGNGRPLFPEEDGKDFFARLEPSFSRSSTAHIETSEG